LHQIEDWSNNLYDLAVQLDRFRHDPRLAQERESLPQELETLSARVHQEQNVDVQQQLEEVVASKHKQWEFLRALDERMEQAASQLAQSNADLATVCSQAQRMTSQDVHNQQTDQLRQKIAEQITQVHDLVISINEIYDYQRD
jgi:chromosome segregation ATPase